MYQQDNVFMWLHVWNTTCSSSFIYINKRGASLQRCKK